MLKSLLLNEICLVKKEILFLMIIWNLEQKQMLVERNRIYMKETNVSRKKQFIFIWIKTMWNQEIRKLEIK